MMPHLGELRIALLGVGTIGRELIRRTMAKPSYRYVALADKSGVLVSDEGFSEHELSQLIKLKVGC